MREIWKILKKKIIKKMWEKLKKINEVIKLSEIELN